MITIRLSEKVKLSSVLSPPESGVEDWTFEASITAGGGIIDLEPVPGENLNCYAKALQVGFSEVEFKVTSLDGTPLSAKIVVVVTPEPAESLTIVAGTPEPQ